MQASQAVLEFAGGGYEASLNHYQVGGNTYVTTVQLDRWVYVVGQDDFNVGRYDLDAWLGRNKSDVEPDMIECDDPEQAWELLRLVREGALLWQCGACDGWIFTEDRPRIGVLECSTCCDGGVDFRHADRHLGDS